MASNAIAVGAALGRVRRKLRAVREEAVAEVGAAIMREAMELAQGIHARTPEDTGDLKRSITVRKNPRTPAGAIVSAGDADAFYARWVEFGTVHALPQPFFFPTYRARRSLIKRRIAKAVREAVRKAAAGK